jgi:uncharacterized protein (DUF952 family)
MIFHILQTAEWEHERSNSIYTPATFEQEGFIHLCDEEQIAGVVERYFPEPADLVALCIEPDKLKAELRYENLLGGEELFPHLYGPLNLDAVLEVLPIRHWVE